MATEIGPQPRERRKRWSGIQLQYGLPTPVTSPKLEYDQWTPIEQRVNALAEVHRLQERFAALARSENARVLGEPPQPRSRPSSFDGGALKEPSPRSQKMLSHRISRSFDSLQTYDENLLSDKFMGEKWREHTKYDLSDPQDLDSDLSGCSLEYYDDDSDDADEEEDDDDDDDEANDSSILMLRARDLKRALSDTKRQASPKIDNPQSLSEASAVLVAAFKTWCFALLSYAANGERALRLYISVAMLLVVLWSYFKIVIPIFLFILCQKNH